MRLRLCRSNMWEPFCGAAAAARIQMTARVLVSRGYPA